MNDSIARLNRPQEAERRQCVIRERDALLADGQPLILGGREPYRLWGYMRHRKVYETGRLMVAAHATAQSRIDREEQEREASEASRQAAIEEEKASYAKERARLLDQGRAVNSDPNRSTAQKDAYNEATRARMERLARSHQKTLESLGVARPAPVE